MTCRRHSHIGDGLVDDINLGILFRRRTQQKILCILPLQDLVGKTIAGTVSFTADLVLCVQGNNGI